MSNSQWLSASVMCLSLGLLGCPAGESAPLPCDPVWGDEPASGRVYVEPGGSGDGTRTAPVGTLQEGLALARAGRQRQIVLFPGSFSGEFTLSQNIPDWQDSGLQIVGCGRGESVLEGIEEEEEGELLVQPVFDITGQDTVDVLLRDLTVSGGRRAVSIRGGAGATGGITVLRVDITESLRVGLLLDGAQTVGHLEEVLVDGVAQEDGAFGWGISIQNALFLAGTFPSPTVLDTVTVRNVAGVGIIIDGANVELTDVVVENVVSNPDGSLGRGIQVQNWSKGTLLGVLVEGTNEAAMFLESPGRPVSDAGARGGDCDGFAPDIEPVSIVDSDLLGTSPVGAANLADGLVATQFSPTGAYCPTQFNVQLTGTSFDANPRSHVLAETVLLELGAGNSFGGGSDYNVAAQADAVVEALGGGPPPETPSVPTNALTVNREPLGLDDLIE